MVYDFDKEFLISVQRFHNSRPEIWPTSFEQFHAHCNINKCQQHTRLLQYTGGKAPPVRPKGQRGTYAPLWLYSRRSSSTIHAAAHFHAAQTFINSRHACMSRDHATSIWASEHTYKTHWRCFIVRIQAYNELPIPEATDKREAQEVSYTL